MVYNELKGLYTTWQQKCHRNTYVLNNKIVFKYMTIKQLMKSLFFRQKLLVQHQYHSLQPSAPPGPGSSMTTSNLPGNQKFIHAHKLAPHSPNKLK